MLKKILNSTVIIAFWIASIFAIKLYVFELGIVNGTSMYPNLMDSNLIFIDKISWKFNGLKRFDILAVYYVDKDFLFVKRLIGLPGERISYKDNKLYVNDVYVEEGFISKNTYTDDFDSYSLSLVTDGIIPENNYLLLGDNRNNSMDSRILGFVNRNDIVGKCIRLIC